VLDAPAQEGGLSGEDENNGTKLEMPSAELLMSGLGLTRLGKKNLDRF